MPDSSEEIHHNPQSRNSVNHDSVNHDSLNCGAETRPLSSHGAKMAQNRPRPAQGTALRGRFPGNTLYGVIIGSASRPFFSWPLPIWPFFASPSQRRAPEKGAIGQIKFGHESIKLGAAGFPRLAFGQCALHLMPASLNFLGFKP
jgi:hypothetical protein